MEIEILETIIFYPHFCYDCFNSDRMPYYFGRVKNVIKPCPVCGGENVNAVFKTRP